VTKYRQKYELLKDIQVEHHRLEKLISSASEGQLLRSGVAGEWAVKDVLAHLVEWEKLFLDWYRIGIEGFFPTVQPAGMGKKSIDQLNQEFYLRDRLRLLSEVMADFSASYQDVLRTVQAIPESDMFSPGRFAWTGKLLLADYIAANTCSHYHWANSKIRPWLAAQES
jgi:hypothetical protein